MTLPIVVCQTGRWLGRILPAYGLSLYFGFLRSIFGLAVLATLVAVMVLSRAATTMAGFTLLAASLLFCYFLGVCVAPTKHYSGYQAALALGFCLLVSASIYAAWTYRESLLGFNLFYVPSQSMTPTLQPGDIVLVDAWAYHDKPPDAGDIVVFQLASTKLVLVKRVTAANETHFNAAGDNRRESISPHYLRQINQDRLRGKVTAILFNIKRLSPLRGLRSLDPDTQ